MTLETDNAASLGNAALNSQPEAFNTSPMIAVRGLKKRIGREEILRGVELTVAKGETLVIIGRSGGGKSVLLKHLIGLMTPDAGEVWIDGENIIGLTERQLAAVRRKGDNVFSPRSEE